jgi:hypothetical protein
MKKLLIFTILIISTIAAAQPVHRQHGEGCTQDQGHVMTGVDSTYYGETNYSLDSLLINGYKYEHKVIVNTDTVYYTCLRCDSAVYFFQDTVFINLEEIITYITPDAVNWANINDNPPGTGTEDSETITGINTGILLYVIIEEFADGVLAYKINSGSYIEIKGTAFIPIENNDVLHFKLTATDAFNAVTVKVYNYTDNNTELDSFTIKSEAE